ncbi:MAG: hypothetical protein IPK16_17640 [Anaerolineales bacterium]|nr:hypothetical protein [Anaerolineales bacterium]
MMTVLRGRRSGFLWSLALFCALCIGTPIAIFASGSPLLGEVQARWSTWQTRDMVDVVRGYRAGEQAALLTLSDDVLAQLPVFAQGEALDMLGLSVRTLRAQGVYAKIEDVSFKVERVAPQDPYVFVTTDEVLTFATYALTPGDGSALERKTGTWEVLYQLARDEGRWKVAKVVATEK